MRAGCWGAGGGLRGAGRQSLLIARSETVSAARATTSLKAEREKESCL